MSSARGNGRGRGRGRGGFKAVNGATHSDDEGKMLRGNWGGRGNARGAPAAARGFPTGPRSKQLRPQQPRSNSAPPKPNTALANPRGANAGDASGGSYAQRYQTLKANREKERKNAIANGFLADPDKPRTLAEAITPVGTCQDMCAEWERVERIVQKDVWEPEYDPESVGNGYGNKVPAEHRMVKKFRRAAAGVDEQLPSDLRPPHILKKTVDYLLNELIDEAPSLSSVHHFIWDRTRAIRNDFSIQQVSKASDVRIAIECYERIARFHILSMHQLALHEKPYDAYEWFQEREQLDRTLLSLVQYYDDSRGKYQAPNEAEFRAYCIVFQIRAHIPDMEDRVQEWPPVVQRDPRVQKALKLYAAAANVEGAQGPLNPRTNHAVAQENPQKFWAYVGSEQISYLMGCVSEVYFNTVRQTALNNIWQSYRAGGNTRTEDWTLKEMTYVLGYDDEEDTRMFLEHYGFRIAEKEDRTEFLDLTSVQGKQLPDPSPGIPNQLLSHGLVETKRHGRTFSAVINGMSVRAARAAGMIEDSDEMVEDAPAPVPVSKEKSLFVTGDSESDTDTEAKTKAIPTINSLASAASNPFASAIGSFGKPAGAGLEAPGAKVAAQNNIFGKPGFPAAVSQPASTTGTSGPAFGSPASGFSGFKPTTTPSNPFSPATTQANPFGAPPPAPSTSSAESLFSFPKATSNTAVGPTTTLSPFNPSTSTSGPGSTFSFAAPAAPLSSKTSFPDSLQSTSRSAKTSPQFQLNGQGTTTPTTTPPGSFSFDKPPEPKLTGQENTTPTTTPPGSFSFEGKPAQSPKPSSSFSLPQSSAAAPGPSSSPMFGFSPASSSDKATTATPSASTFSGTGLTSPKPAEQPSAATKQAEKSTANPFGFTPSQLGGGSSSTLFQKPASATTSAPATGTFFGPSTTGNSASTGASFSQPAPLAPTNVPASITSASESTPPFNAESSASVGFSFFRPNPSISSTSSANNNRQSTNVGFKPTTPTKETSTPAQPSTSLAPPKKSHKEIVTEKVLDTVTKDLLLEPNRGLLTQFIEHIAEPIIMDAFEEFEHEQNLKAADAFREYILGVRYLRLWREIWWSNHLRRRGRERRKARRSAVAAATAAKNREERVETDVQGFRKSMGVSKRKRASSNDRARGQHGFADSFRSSISMEELAQKDAHDKNQAERPLSLQKQSLALSRSVSPGSVSSSHRRTQTDPLAASQSSRSIFRSSMRGGSSSTMPPPAQPTRYRASFLIGQPLIPKQSTFTGRISTTRSEYFRLKAIGVNYHDVYGPNKKRQREIDDEGEDPNTSAGASRSLSPPERKKRTVLGRSTSQRPSQSRTPSVEHRLAATPSSAPSRYSHEKSREQINAEDDALIARFKAIRKTLAEGAEFMRSTREEEERRDFRTSQSSIDPLAQSYSSFRQSHFPQAEPSAASANLPKYWSRESKFLPRSEYGGGRWLAAKQKIKEEPGKQEKAKIGLAATNSQPFKSPPNPSQVRHTSGQPSQNTLLFQRAAPSQPSANLTQDAATVQPRTSFNFSRKPIIVNNATGSGTQDDEIMILSSDDEDNGTRASGKATPAKAEVTPQETQPTIGDEDNEILLNGDDQQSVEDDAASRYADSEYGVEHERQYGQGIERYGNQTFGGEEWDEQEGTEEEDEEDEDDDEDDEDDEDDDDVESNEGVEDEFGASGEEDEQSEEGENMGSKYKGAGNSFEDAIEL